METPIVCLFIVFVLLVLLMCKKCNTESFIDNNQYHGNKKFTAIVQNYNRPQMAKKLLNLLEKCPHIDEVLLLEANKENILESVPSKVRQIDCVSSNETMGLRIRFHYTQNAKNDNVLYIDDDMYPTDKCVSFLLKKVIEDPKTIHGIYGRSEDNYNSIGDILITLGLQPNKQDVDIVLTKIMATTKSNAMLFEKNAHLIERITLNSPGAKWNGEDIYFNMLVTRKTQKQNKIYNLPHSFDEGEGISSSPNHMDYRIKLIEAIKNIPLESFDFNDYDVGGL